MCNTCGCGTGTIKIETVAGRGAAHRHEGIHIDVAEAEGQVPDLHEHDHLRLHDHAHDHHQHDHVGATHFGHGPVHSHAPGMSQERMLRIEEDILAVNNRQASDNRLWMQERGIFALNMVSSPGSGKTSLLVRTIQSLDNEMSMAVVEGDQQTTNDAERIRATGVPALQINTGKGCHLDASMLAQVLDSLQLTEESLLFIENVGNLVCPASFDLGEAHKVVVLSVTEGEDKPLKYPDMFHASDLMLLNKIDLLPHLSFDVAQCKANARRVHPTIEFIEVSAQSGAGFDAWLDWLRAGVASVRQQRQQRQQTVESLQRRVAELEARLAERG